jgi:hypothetical protein
LRAKVDEGEMRDHYVRVGSGEVVPVAHVSDAVLAECLRGDGRVTDADGYSDSTESVMERLRIEVLIRSLGLR